MKGGTVLFYVGYALLWACGITAAGALVGALVVPLIGTIAGSERGWLEMMRSGARNIGFLTFIWAPGIGIVLAFHRAYTTKKRHTAGPNRGPAPSPRRPSAGLD